MAARPQRLARAVFHATHAHHVRSQVALWPAHRDRKDRWRPHHAMPVRHNPRQPCEKRYDGSVPTRVLRRDHPSIRTGANRSVRQCPNARQLICRNRWSLRHHRNHRPQKASQLIHSVCGSDLGPIGHSSLVAHLIRLLIALFIRLLVALLGLFDTSIDRFRCHGRCLRRCV